MRDSSSLLPTSSVEMKTDQFSSYAYGKAVLVFAATTVAYFALKAAGLPHWFWDSSPSGSGELKDSALTSRESTSLVTPEVQPETAIFSRWGELEVESSLTDFKIAELTLPLLLEPVDESGISQSDEMASTADTSSPVSRRLLQSSGLSIARKVPDQYIQIDQSYRYSLANVFSSSNPYVLVATQTGQSRLPDWLSFQYELLSTYLGEASDVAVSGSIAFVATGSINILNISNLNKPQLLVNYAISAESITVSGSRIFITAGDGLSILDVSNLSQPQLLGTYLGVPGNYYYDVAALGSTVFIAAGGLVILDVSNPIQPQLLTTYPPPSAGDGSVAVSGSMAFVTAEGSGLQILDVSNPSQPQLLYTYPPISGDSFEVAVSGKTAFISSYSNLQIVNINDISDPQLLGVLPVSNFINGMTVSGSILFVGQGGSGLQIMNMSQGWLVGAPPVSSISGQTVPITLTAQDLVSGELLSCSFTLTLYGLPSLPQTTLSDQTIFPGQVVSLPLSTNLFVSSTPLGLSLSLEPV